MPTFSQLFVAARAAALVGMALERLAFCLRKRAEHETDVYFPSLSSRTIAYKGMLTTDQLDHFFPDLVDERVASAVAVVHSRFSTNTFPSWPLAHPFRFIAHNGEINTVMGNRNWMRAREALLASDLIPGDLDRLFPICTPGASDSASFDEVLELLHLGGRTLPHSVLMMIPEAWENHTEMDAARTAFYEFHASMMEPWDGPACVVFTDGTQVGAVLDRNGLRPSRYWVTDDGLVVLASEVGVLDIDPATVVRKGRLQPGRMFLVDTDEHRIIEDEEIKGELAAEHPYDEWLHAGLVRFEDLPDREHIVHTHASVTRRQQVFGYTEEEKRVLLTPMAQDRRRADRLDGHRHPDRGAVGPAAAAVRLLRAAVRPGHQPAARRDPRGARHLAGRHDRPGGQPARADAGVVPPAGAAVPGDRQRRAGQDPAHQPRRRPARLRHPRRPAACTTSTAAATALADRLDEICAEVSAAIADGARIIVLSDRHSTAELAPIPSLLLTGAVHHHLVREKTRTQVGLVVEAGDVREVHHVALLIGYGAAAVNPYLAMETVEDLARDGYFVDVEPEQAVKNLVKALGKGVLKVMSKMGVSTVASYTGAQIFEARRPVPAARRPLLHRHHQQARRRRPRRHRRGGRPPAPQGLPGRRPAAGAPHARDRRRVPVAPRGRAAPVRPRDGLPAAALHPHRPLRHLQAVHRPRRRAVRAADDAARPVRAPRGRRASRSRSTRSSRSPRSSSGSPPARCPTARSARRRTRRSRSR